MTITGGAVSDVEKKSAGEHPPTATLSFPGGTAEFPIRTAAAVVWRDQFSKSFPRVAENVS